MARKSRPGTPEMLGALRVMPKWTAPVTEPPVAGYVGWWDASDTATITESGGAVSAWADKSASGFDVSQSTAGNKPTTGAATINGRNVLSFATNDFLARATTPSWSLVALTIFAVWELTTTGTYQVVIEDSAGSNSVNVLNTDVGYMAESAGIAVTGVGSAMGLHQYTAVYISGGTQSKLFRDGAQDGATSSTGSATWTGLTIGSRAGSYPTNGKLAEFIVYDSALGTTDREAVEAYMKAKWGTP